MPRRKHIPSYRLHKQSGQAIVTLTDGLGGRQDVLLGKFGTPESRTQYARVIAEWETAGQRLKLQDDRHRTVSVNELLLAFWRHAEIHYRDPDGNPTQELENIRAAVRPLKEMYGLTTIQDFGPLALKAVRQKLIQTGLSRGVVNARVNRIRRVFRWGVENELVSPSILEGLRAIRGLERGRSGARETEPVGLVSEAVVNDTLPHLQPAVADMVRLQLATGMRPGELVIMRTCDLDTTGRVWFYRTCKHKNAHRGHERVVALGPAAKHVVRHYLKTDLQAFLFSPREVMAAWRERLRAARKTKVQPSQTCRRKRKPKRVPGERYTVKSYASAIAHAVAKGNRERLKGGPIRPGDYLPHWHPHQLRHTAATKLRRELGLDIARAVLGHRSPQVTELYAQIDMTRAAEAMERLG
jgi:integrase